MHPAHLAHSFSGLLHAAKCNQRLTSRFFWWHSCGDVFLYLDLKMKSQFVLHVGIRTPAAQHCSQPIQHLHGYSYLSATSGSTRVARRAGSQHATKLTSSRMNATATRVAGSPACTP